MIGSLRQFVARFSDRFRIVVPHDLVHAVWLMEVSMGFEDDEFCEGVSDSKQYSRTEIYSIDANIEVRFSEIDGMSGATAEIIYAGETLYSDDFDSLEEAKSKTVKWIKVLMANFLTLHDKINANRTGVYRRRFPWEKKPSEAAPAKRKNQEEYPSSIDSEQEEQEYKRYIRESKVIGFSDDDIPL